MNSPDIYDLEAEKLKIIKELQERETSLIEEIRTTKIKINATDDKTLKEHYDNVRLRLIELIGIDKEKKKDHAQSLYLIQKEIKEKYETIEIKPSGKYPAVQWETKYCECGNMLKTEQEQIDKVCEECI